MTCVLGIETSCDETAAAVVDGVGLRADVTTSQAIHAAFGGVVPEIAARAHVETIGIVVAEALARAERAGAARPDAVAATAGPGLIGAVLVGFAYGKALALGWGVPFVAVNHLEGHVLAPTLADPTLRWPYLALVVSGGHTALYRVDGLGAYVTLGRTVDDAAGEAYDKVARMLGLAYPGGPAVDSLAALGNPEAVALPRPRPGDLDFSFSGLKTAVRSVLSGDPARRPSDADLCASFQAAVVDCLVGRVVEAARRTGVRRVTLGGGVAANRGLRAALAASGLDVTLPPVSLCTDNAAMIAHVGRLWREAGRADPLDVPARSSWPIA